MVDDPSEIDWRQVMADLRAGKIAEIPVTSDEARDKMQQRMTRRAERHGMQVEFSVGAGVLQVRRVAEIAPRAEDAAERRERRARREQREERERRREGAG